MTIAPLDPVASFEAARSRLLLRSRVSSAAWVLGFSALLAASVWGAGLLEVTLGGDPWARVEVFLDRLTPDLRGEELFGARSQAGSLAAWWYDLPRWLRAAAETLQIALLATALATGLASLAALFASRATMPLATVRFVTRRILEALRTIPDLILALILVAAFGVGPLAGVVALTLGATGSLGKLFTEAAENADPRQMETVRAAGGGWAAQVRYGLAPQVAPTIASYALLRVEINISSAAALGVVGAGGIGMELERAITFAQFDTYLALLLVIVALIMACDALSAVVRGRLIGREARA